MHNRSLFYTTALSIALIFSSTLCARHYHDKESPVATAAKVGVATGAIAAGAYALYSFFSGPSDEEVVAQAQNTFDEIMQRHTNQLNACKAILGTAWHSAASIAESSLLALNAQLFGTNERAIDHCISTVQKSINELRNAYDTLDKQKASSQSASARQDMQRISNNIESLKRDLHAFLTILDTHHTYFRAYSATHTMHDRYSQEIRALENNARDRQLLREKVRSIIIRTYPHTAYPYINYAEAIHNDYRHFEPYVHALNAHTYPQLTLDAQKTLDLLAQLHDLVVTDSEYLASLRDRERKQLEQERIEAQRAYAAAQQRQARALEHQNNIQERQMYAARRCCCHPHCGPVCVEYVEIVPVPAPVHVGFSVGW